MIQDTSNKYHFSGHAGEDQTKEGTMRFKV
jgi:hypothetical protein